MADDKKVCILFDYKFFEMNNLRQKKNEIRK